jgi:hypothetical protein
MHNPDTFYPVKTRGRDIYIKNVSSQLINQVTMGETAVNLIWL